MVTVESTFREALHRATLTARAIGLAVVNAEMVAADAVEDAWLVTMDSPDNLVPYAIANAKRMAYRELRRMRRFSILVDGFDEDSQAQVVGVEAEQESNAQTSIRLGDVQGAMARFDEPRRSILLLMLRGLGSVEIAKETRIAVPLVIQSIKTIRLELATP